MSKDSKSAKTYRYFMAALQEVLRGETRQIDIAEMSGLASQSINGYIKGRKVAGMAAQEKMALACGYDYLDFLTWGRELIDGPQETLAEESEPLHQSPTDVLSMVASLVDNAGKTERQLSMWRSIYEYLPVPTYVLRGGLVIHQNSAAVATCGFQGIPGSIVTEALLGYACTFMETVQGMECTIKMCPLVVDGEELMLVSILHF